MTAPAPVKRSVYHKEIPVSAEDAARGHVVIDVYRVLRAFGVTDHNLGHAIKKLLVPGRRSGGKSAEQDVAEAIWTLQRWEEMNREEGRGDDAILKACLKGLKGLPNHDGSGVAAHAVGEK